jgi:hypothetical protein
LQISPTSQALEAYSAANRVIPPIGLIRRTFVNVERSADMVMRPFGRGWLPRRMPRRYSAVAEFLNRVQHEGDIGRVKLQTRSVDRALSRL